MLLIKKETNKYHLKTKHNKQNHSQISDINSATMATNNRKFNPLI